jgi:AcrR family transcriptional regulator
VAVAKRGADTRERLLAATQKVVSEVGYAHATTRAIARAAGVAEGTIYRHFPDKLTLFFTAALAQDTAILEQFATLPERAGTGTVSENLVWAVTQLAALREQVLPLELALLSDPDLAVMRTQMPPPPALDPDPPRALIAYLLAEQRLGRIRPDLDSEAVVPVMLAALFGVAVMPPLDGGDKQRLPALVDLFVRGLLP